MADIDIELEGLQSLKQDFEDVKDDWGQKEVWAVGTNTEYGRILEFGRGPITADEGSALSFSIGGEDVVVKSVSGHQPYPWFRPAIREFEANPERFIEDNTDLDSFETISSTGELVRSVAFALQSKMEDNVNAQDAARDRSPGTHPDHPQRDTGNLTASIQATRIR